MKTIVFSLALFLSFLAVSGQDQDLQSATTTKSTRLFKAKDDLTSVIVIIPSGSTVTILGSDSTYLHVRSGEDEGFIFSRHATVNAPASVSREPEPQAEEEDEPVVMQPHDRQVTTTQQQPRQKVSRFSYLESKYGTNLAARMMSGKIWKGMSTEMVNDAWGTALKINRVVNGNTMKEEWVYKSAWLYFVNDQLVDWGPARRQQ